MEKSSLSDNLKTVSVSSMLTYFKGLSAENQKKILVWAKSSKNPDTNVNTVTPSDWEKNMKKIFSQLSSSEQAEVVTKASKIYEERKGH